MEPEETHQDGGGGVTTVIVRVEVSARAPPLTVAIARNVPAIESAV
jgi:hypothetical protein